MRVLACGSRHFEDKAIIATVLEGLLNRSIQRGEPLVIIEGCAKGADSIAGDWADSKLDQLVSIRIEHLKFPADWNQYGKGAGPIRNKQMLDEGKPSVVIAFSNDIENSRGTSNMISQAKKASIRTYLISEY